MKKEALFEIEREGKTLRIFQDSESGVESRSWDNLGTIKAWHRRYSLSDKDAPNVSHENWDDWVEENDVAVCLNLYMLDHSGIALSTRPFNDYWDSGQVGYIFVTKKRLVEELLTEERARVILEGEIETLNQEFRGEVYGYTVTTTKKCEHCGHVEEEKEDSCWGFIGEFDEVKEQIMSETGFKMEKITG
jgi:hypothetical protein